MAGGGAAESAGEGDGEWDAAFFPAVVGGRVRRGGFEVPRGGVGGVCGGAAARYGFQGKSVVAVGYSNGANIASGTMLLHPRVLAGAILLRPMVPFAMEEAPDLRGVHVLLGAGKRDPIVPEEHIGGLMGMFESAGADVSVHWHAGGHELGQDDVAAAKDWLQRQRFTSR